MNNDNCKKKNKINQVFDKLIDFFVGCFPEIITGGAAVVLAAIAIGILCGR